MRHAHRLIALLLPWLIGATLAPYKVAVVSGLPSSSEIALVTEWSETQGYAPLPVIGYADTYAGTTSTWSADPDRDLSYDWDWKDTAGNYAAGGTYQYDGMPTGVAHDGGPIDIHAFTAPGTFTPQVIAEDGNGEREGDPQSIQVDAWPTNQMTCVAPTDPGNDAAWVTLGCPRSDAESTGNTVVGTNLNTILAGLTLVDGDSVYPLGDGTTSTFTSTGNLAAPDGVTWKLDFSQSANPVDLARTGSNCSTPLFAQRRGAGYLYLVGDDQVAGDGLIIDNEGGSGEPCNGSTSQYFMPEHLSGNGTQGVIIQGITWRHGSPMFILDVAANAAGGVYPDQHHGRIWCIDCKVESPVATAEFGANMFMVGGVEWGVIDSHIRCDGPASICEFHVRSQYRDGGGLMHNLHENMANGKGQITLRGCSHRTRCGGNGTDHDITNADEEGGGNDGLFAQRFIIRGGVYDALGTGGAIISIAPQNRTSCAEGARDHYIIDAHIRNTGATVVVGSRLVAVEGPTYDTQIKRLSIDAQAFDNQNDYVTQERGNGQCEWGNDDNGPGETPGALTGEELIPDRFQGLAWTLYGGSQTQAPASILRMSNGSSGTFGNLLLHTPSWSGTATCECRKFSTTCCEAATPNNDWGSLGSQGYVDQDTLPFVSSVPATTTAQDFKLKASPNVDGIATPPAGFTDFVRTDSEANGYSAQAGAWANQ